MGKAVVYKAAFLDIYFSLFPPTMVDIVYRQYTGEADLPHIISLVEHELSEPYVIYTYRYFLNQWYVSSFSYFRSNDSPRLT